MLQQSMAKGVSMTDMQVICAKCDETVKIPNTDRGDLVGLRFQLEHKGWALKSPRIILCPTHKDA